jgi:hypothetical protein
MPCKARGKVAVLSKETKERHGAIGALRRRSSNRPGIVRKY